MPERSRLLGARALTLLALCGAALLAGAWLKLDPSELVDPENRGTLAQRFFAAAAHPAWDYETAPPTGSPSFWNQALEAARRTVVFATAGLSLALLFGFPLGLLCAWSFWSPDAKSRPLARTLWTLLRSLAAAMRSVHELLWAMLFLAAFGISELAAVLAIAIPFTGTFAKIFSELLDESESSAVTAMRDSGATSVQTFFLARFPHAAPDIAAYSFYRFECALRSAAILGFFGYPTLGLRISQAFENLHFREVWTYLYLLLALVLLAEGWSGALRRRFVA